MGGVEREDYKVDSASPRLSNLECQCHPKSRRVMGVGSFREKDKSCFNVMGVLTEDGEGNGNPLQYSYLGNSMDRGAWQARVHGAAEELNTAEPLNNHNNESGCRISQGTRWK